jgi:hypothetical protein
VTEVMKYVVRHNKRRWSVCMPIDAEMLYKCGVDAVTGKRFKYTNEVSYRARRLERRKLCAMVVGARSRVPACNPGEMQNIEFNDLSIRPARQGSLARAWRRFHGYE